MDLENIISREEIQNYHKDFKNVKAASCAKVLFLL